MYEKGLVVNPDCFEILVNAGGLFTDTRDDDRAIAMYNKAIKLQPNSPALIANIGWLTELQGKLEEARESYIRSLDLLKPETHPQIISNLKNVEAKIKKQLEMKEDARKSKRGKDRGHTLRDEEL